MCVYSMVARDFTEQPWYPQPAIQPNTLQPPTFVIDDGLKQLLREKLLDLRQALIHARKVDDYLDDHDCEDAVKISMIAAVCDAVDLDPDHILARD